MTKIKDIDNHSIDKSVQLGPIIIAGFSENGTASANNRMFVPQKLKIKLSYDSVIPLLGTYQKELKAKSQRDIFTALFTVVKTWKQLKCVC